MDPDDSIHLKVYLDDNRLLIGDLYTLRPRCEMLLGLHDVAHAASGHDTLGMVFTRSNVEREASIETESFGCSWSRTLWGDDVQAYITFWPFGTRRGWD
jgi:hypothetical protein